MEKPTWKRRLLLNLGAGLAGALTALAIRAAWGYHKADPTFLNRRKLEITDQFTQTQEELDLEKEFGISYYGPKDKTTLFLLHDQLRENQEQTPALTQHLTRIYFHDHATQESPIVKPFLDYAGRAHPIDDSIELCNLSPSTLTHELAHVAHFNASETFKRAFRALHENDFGKDLKPRKEGFFKDLAPTWQDGTEGPRHGFVRPYGAKNEYEALATYVETSWDQVECKKPAYHDPRYLETLDLLNQHSFLSTKTVEEARQAILSNNPTLVQKELIAVTEHLPEPTLIRSTSAQGSSFYQNTYYESPTLKITFVGSMYGSTVCVEVRSEGGLRKGVNFYIDPYTGKIVPSVDSRPFVPPIVTERLGRAGYFNAIDSTASEQFANQ